MKESYPTKSTLLCLEWILLDKRSELDAALDGVAFQGGLILEKSEYFKMPAKKISSGKVSYISQLTAILFITKIQFLTFQTPLQ